MIKKFIYSFFVFICINIIVLTYNVYKTFGKINIMKLDIITFLQCNFSIIPFRFIILSLIVSFVFYVVIHKFRSVYSYYRIIFIFFIVVLLLVTVRLFITYKIFSYISNGVQTSDFYEKYYVDAKNVNIISPKNKRNLILIFLESMEFSYANKDFFPDNLIPELINLSNNNISFKNFYNGYYQNNTQTAIVATMTGLPSKNLFIGIKDSNSIGTNLKSYLKNSSSIRQILRNKGYTTLFLQGSEKEFAGADVFLEMHGFKDSIFDSFYLKQTYNINNVPEWYVADKDVINVFKKKISQLKNKTPFFAVMVTADTHMWWNGVKNPQIPDISKNFSNDKVNIIRNSSILINDFVNWIRKQSFAKDTTIVLIGDHLRMDDGLFENYSKERYIYNCFINSVYDDKKLNKDRTFWQIDLFPTILQSIGFEIEGDKLGLGTSLFSDKKTLLESFGEKELKLQLAKRNKLYDNLWKDK